MDILIGKWKTDVYLAGQLDSWIAGHICLAFPFLEYIFDIYINIWRIQSFNLIFK